MESSRIQTVLNRYSELSLNTLNAFLELAEELEVASGDDFIRKGSHDQYEYMVMEGICRSYLLNPDGEEVTISFYPEQTVISPFVIRTRGGISSLNFQALVPSVLVRFSAKDFLDLMVRDLEMRAWGNEVLKRELDRMFEKEIEMASMSARDRLIRFRETFPGFENRISHGIIASYLGITNVSLSRLRKETL